jgi:hypothetical protein
MPNSLAHIVQIGIQHALRHLHVNPLVREVGHDHADLANWTTELPVISFDELRYFVVAVVDDDSVFVVGIDVRHELRHVVVAVDELGHNSNNNFGAAPYPRVRCHTLYTRSALPTRVWPGDMRPRTAALPAKEVQPVIARLVWEPPVTSTPCHLVELVVVICPAGHAPYAHR